jgi:phosphopantothenate-cysteine ligase
LLIPKARASLERYGHQVVIGNMLTTRKFEVVFVSSSSLPGEAHSEGSVEEEWLRLPGSWVEGVKGGDAKVPADPETSQQPTSKPAVTEIEEIIIEKLVGMHSQWINQPAVSNEL